MAADRPPLELHAELVYPDGTSVRWDGDSREAKDRPTGISFRTARYVGFADGNLTLARDISRDYPDLGLLDGINLVGYGGSVAFEGWAGSIPRSLQGSPQIGIQMQGWMGSAKDQTFVECYVDRDLSKWTSPSAATTARVLEENFSLGSIGQPLDEAGNPCVELGFSDAWTSPYRPQVQPWWLPRAGVKLGAVYYDLAGYNAKTMSGVDTNWIMAVYLLSDDKGTANDRTAAATLWPGAAGYLTATGDRVAAAIQMYYNGTPGGTAGAAYFSQWTNLALYGAHGLTRQGVDPGGFYVSDMMRDIAQRFAPKLDTSGIEDTTYVVPHASFLDDIAPYDAWQTLNTYHRWEMAVYEGRKLLYYPLDLNDHDWEVRLSDDETVGSSLQGDDSTHLCNGVTVRYRDLGTGYETRLSPDDFPELKDESPDNPANLNGRKLYPTLVLSNPTDQAGAIQIGRVYLAEFNQALAPGTLTIKGHIRDAAGHWQPVWKVRAGDRLVIADLPNDRVRVVGETNYNHDSLTIEIGVDAGLKRLDAILARLGVAVEAANLSLP
jgi:hypothetical protein